MRFQPRIPALLRKLAFLALLAALPCLLSATGRLLQEGTLSSLVDGVYDGSMPMETIQRPDAYGLGTFDKLDGEMIVLGGVVYHVGVDGKVTKPAVNSLVPFACVSVPDDPDIGEDVGASASKDDFQTFILSRLESLNYPALIIVEGDFDMMKTRSVPAQQKPYPPLAQVVADGQVVFELGAQKGTLVGFYFPSAFAVLNAAGFHFHFLNDAREAGGHILDMSLKKGHLRIQTLTSMQLILPPKDSAFAQSDLEPATPVAKVQGE
jgi:acetolactate decarboxylase